MTLRPLAGTQDCLSFLVVLFVVTHLLLRVILPGTVAYV
jgi:hypothetical protein